MIIRFQSQATFDNDKHRIRVLWTPHQASRSSLLQFLRVNWYCRRATIICHVFRNNILWPELDSVYRTIDFGDYIRVQIRSDREQFCDMLYSEGNSRRQRILESSSEERDAGEHQLEDAEESPESEPTPRSHSRERTPRRNRAGGLSMLQLSVALFSTDNVSVSTFDRLPPPGNGIGEVDLRHSLQCLDDWSQHDWGFCYFDFDSHTCQRVNAVRVELPTLRDLCEQLHAPPACPMPIQTLHDNVEQFDEDLQPIVKALDYVQHEQPEVMHIYTDGSFDSSTKTDDTVGWGFAAFHCGPTGFTLRYMACGCIFDDTCPVVHGVPVALNARTGEVEALIQAILWSLASLENTPIELYYDAITVGHGGMGQWNFNRSDRHMRILRALAQYAERFHEQGFVGYHVQAHDGTLGNEIANFLAQHARLQQVQWGTSKVELGSYVIGERMPLEWLWTMYIPQSNLEEAYPDFQDGSIHATGLTTTADVSLALPTLLQPTGPTGDNITYADFGVATYNVGSLQNASGTVQDTVLRTQEYLRQQAHCHEIDCLFLQETRAKNSNLISSDTHLRLVAASNNRKGGTEIWLRKRRVNGTATGLKQQDVLVLVSEPELMIARVRWPYGSFLLVSAHAPHSGWSSGDIENWWQQLSRTVTGFHTPLKEWLIIGIDANARFDGEDQPWIGPYGVAAKSNKAAQHFADLLRQHGLFLPATFEEYHSGTSQTWRANSDLPGARCDYICLPMQWKTFQPRSQNLPSLDAGTAAYDHTPVGVWCCLSFTRMRRSKPQFDTRKIPAAMAAHGQSLQRKVMSIPWETDVHQHAAVMADTIAEWLNEHCPKDKQGPKSTYISERTWEIRRLRLWYSRSVRHMNEIYYQHRLRIALLAWRHRLTFGETADQGFHVTWEILKAKRSLVTGLATTRSLLKRGLRDDRTAYLEGVARSAMMDHPNALHRHLRSVGVMGKNKRQALQPLPCLRNADGELVTTFQQWAEVWRSQFEQQEDGCACTREELFENCVARQVWDRELDLPPEWTQLPTLGELEAVLRQTCTGKSFFDDGVPGEVLHYGAGVLAPSIFPLLLKQWLFNREALLFKGGLLVPAYKKGDPTDPSNFRSLLISCTLGKAFHRILRKDLMSVFEPKSLPLQLGGRPGIAVTQAAHSLHLFLHAQRCAHRPCAVLFLDIKNAFYRLFRQQLTKTGVLTRSVEELFISLQLPEEAYLEFCANLQGPTATEDIDTPRFLQAQVRELLNTTWFVVSGSEAFTEARKGSRPGDSVADLLFTIAFRHLLNKVRIALLERGVLLEVPWSGAREPHGYARPDDPCIKEEVLGPVWADDLAIMLTASSSEELLSNVSQAAGILFDTLLLSGMQPNLGPSKTELLLELRGANSVPHRKKLALEGYALSTTSQLLKQNIRVVGAYKHLGTWIQVNGKLGRELSCRFAIGHSTITKYRSSIFANRAMSLEKKLQLFQSLILSAVLFNSPIWMMTRKQDVTRFYSGLMALYRRVAVGHWGIATRGWRDEKIQARLGLPEPTHLLHVHRLRYLQHLVRAGDSTLWAMLQQHSYWWQLVDVSLDWLRSQLLCQLPEGSVMEMWSHWEPWLKPPGRRWQNMLKKAQLHATLQNRKHAAWWDFHTEICRTVIASGLQNQPMDVQPWDMHACPCCRQTFKTNAAWSVHAFRKHGRVTPARQFAVGNTCEFCLKTFHDHMGLVNHIGNNPHCYWQYHVRGQTAEPQPSFNSRAEIKVRSDLRCPAYKVDGPRPPPCTVGDLRPNEDQVALMDAWEEVRQNFPHDRGQLEEIREALRKATLFTTLPVFEILHVARSWRLQLHRQGEIDEYSSFFRALTKYIEEFTTPWLFDDQTIPVQSVADPHRMLEVWLVGPAAPVGVPKPIYFKQVMIAHLFSGRRRQGDFQDWASATSWQNGQYKPLPLSVDIIFSETWGNLLNPTTAALFTDAIRSGWLVAVLAGPPCETWSIARQRGLYDDNGPKPLRSLGILEGFGLLTIREVKQLCVGNELLGIALLVAVLLWIFGGICVLEHPSEPSPPEAPSIWRMTAMRYLLHQKMNEKIRVFQGNFGAKSPVPGDQQPRELGRYFSLSLDCCVPSKDGFNWQGCKGPFLHCLLKGVSQCTQPCPVAHCGQPHTEAGICRSSTGLSGGRSVQGACASCAT